MARVFEIDAVARWARGWRLVVILAALALCVYLVRAILLPFIVGLIAAYILDPLVDRMEQAGINRVLATTVLTVGLTAFIVIALLLILPLLISQTLDLVASLPDIITQFREQTWPAFRSLVERSFLGSYVDFERLTPQLFTDQGIGFGVVNEALRSILVSTLHAVNVIALIVIAPVIAFYLVRDWHQFTGALWALVPPQQRDDLRDIINEIDDVLAGFLRGQALVCAFLGIFYGVGLSLTGLPYGFTIGLATGVFTFVPYVGMAVGVLIGMGVALVSLDSWLMIVAVGVVFWLGQFIEGNFMTPRLVGSRIRLHPVWVIFAVLAGAAVAGLTGAFFAVPVAAVVAVFVRRAVASYKDSLDKVEAMVASTGSPARSSTSDDPSPPDARDAAE